MTQEEIKAKLGARVEPGDYIPFSVRSLLREWLALQGFTGSALSGMKAKTMAQCYNDPKYLAKVSRALLRKQKLPGGTYAPMPADIDEKKIVSIVEARARSIAAEVVQAATLEITKNAPPRVIEIRKPNAKPKQLKERTHPLFERVMKLTNQGAHILLVGPAGCGKTYMAEQIARSLDLDYGAIHGTAGASESALTGWLLPSKGGNFEYTPAPFVELFEDGDSLFLFDELDAFDPNMLLVVNGALANGHLHIAHRRGKPIVKKGENVHIMATANTYGTGANPMYSGRAPLDAATLDRFVVVSVDYDEALERDIGGAGGLTDDEMRQLWALRRRVREAQLRRTISTRAFQKAVQMKAAGDDWRVTMNTLVEGWSKDEKGKAGILV